MGKKRERVYATVIMIDRGIIQLVEPDGTIGYYRQRGIQKLSEEERQQLIRRLKLHPNWKEFKELPSHYTIYYEDEEIMGKARATFNANR